MKCFYHSADLDGWCSGAIVKLAQPECKMFGIDYGDPFPWESIVEGEQVFMVDFSLPIGEMLKLDKLTALLWIDHHISAIKEYESQNTTIAGWRDVRKAACEICWEAFNPNQPMPESVYLLGRYDVWDHENPEVLPFQYGCRLKATLPGEGMFWSHLMESSPFVDHILSQGRTILRYVDHENKHSTKSYSFDLVWENHYCLCINQMGGGSKLLESRWNPEHYHMMVLFGFRGDKWIVSLRSEGDFDVSVIARLHGGGGHKNAAGFACQELPFDLKGGTRWQEKE